jgi:hypothetical protein
MGSVLMNASPKKEANMTTPPQQKIPKRLG